MRSKKGGRGNKGKRSIASICYYPLFLDELNVTKGCGRCLICVPETEKRTDCGKRQTGNSIYLSSEPGKYLRVFLRDGDVPMDNNASERATRGSCIGKKNWEVIDTINGAKHPP